MRDLRKAAELALEALEQTPTVNKLFDSESYEKQKDAIDALRQALAQPEQEPVAWVYNGILHEFDPSEFATSEVTPLYIAPPKREWVGLTDQETDGLIHLATYMDETDLWHLVILVEKRLKEKNT